MEIIAPSANQWLPYTEGQQDKQEAKRIWFEEEKGAFVRHEIEATEGHRIGRFPGLAAILTHQQ